MSGISKKSGRRVPPSRWLVRVLHVPHSAVPRAPAPPDRRPPPLPRRRRDGFDGFYRVNYPPVVRLAYSLSGSMQVAEELAQEAFVAAHHRWRRIVAFDRPDLWVRRVVINRAISYRRRNAVERRALERMRDRRATHSEIVLDDEEVWTALRELSPRQAQVLALVYVEDQPIAEVAAILDLGEETVRTHLKRGRHALQEKLTEREAAEP